MKDACLALGELGKPGGQIRIPERKLAAADRRRRVLHERRVLLERVELEEQPAHGPRRTEGREHHGGEERDRERVRAPDGNAAHCTPRMPAGAGRAHGRSRERRRRGIRRLWFRQPLFANRRNGLRSIPTRSGGVRPPLRRRSGQSFIPTRGGGLVLLCLPESLAPRPIGLLRQDVHRAAWQDWSPFARQWRLVGGSPCLPSGAAPTRATS